MPIASFETPEGEEVHIDAENVVHRAAGEEVGTTLVELEDGEEITVIGTQLEVAAELGLDPLEYIDPEDDDESIEDLVDEDEDDEIEE